MKRLTLTALALTCALATAPALAAQPAAAAAKPRLSGCYDGKCKFSFKYVVSFRISSKKYGFSKVIVYKEDAKTVVVDTGFNRRIDGRVFTAGGSVAVWEGGWGNISGLKFRVLKVTKLGATIHFLG
ncbi:hypothetical protein [Nonomuraea sp. B19D2]|uniref:hypothetical protein n=1 Tax=Nonomuraea sp. B19D2 TaxID=3159561 RepID=UPI0032DA81C6